MITFNTANLRKVVSLSMLKKDVDNDKIVVKSVTFHHHGKPMDEGVVPLITSPDQAVDLKGIEEFNALVKGIWGSDALVQIGTKNHKAVLFVYG